MSSGEVYIPPETYVWGRVVRAWRKTVLWSWDDRIRVILGMFATSQGSTNFPGVDYGHLVERCVALTGKDRNLANVLDILYRNFSISSGAASAIRWGDKTPMNTFYWKGILRVFPDAKFIATVRNPDDVVASSLKMGRFKTVDEAVKRWRSANEEIMAISECVGRDVLKIISYEDLVIDPESCTRDMKGFLGLESDLSFGGLDTGVKMGDVEALPHHSRALGEIDKTSVGKSKEQLSQNEIDYINQKCLPIMTHLMSIR